MSINCKKYLHEASLLLVYGVISSLSNYGAFLEDGSCNTNSQKLVVGRSFNPRLSVIAFSLTQETLSMGTASWYLLRGAEQVGTRKHAFQHYLTCFIMVFLKKKEEKEHIGKSKVLSV